MLGRGKQLLLSSMAILLLIAVADPVSASSSSVVTYTNACKLTGTSTGAPFVLPNFSIIAALTLVALDLAFDIVALGYLLARFFNLRGLYSWVQGEYYELAKSIFLVVAIYGVLIIVSGIALNLAPSAVSPSSGSLATNIGALITTSESYLCAAENNVTPGWEFLGQEAVAIGLVQGTSVSLYLPLPLPIPFVDGFTLNSGFSMKPYQNYMLESGNIVIGHYESTVFDMLTFVLFPVTSVLYALITLLPTIVDLGLAVFIPLGLIMRAFPFIRGIGGTLIAIGIAAAIIFPALLVLLDQPVAAWAAVIVPAPCGTVGGQASCPAPVCAAGGSVICSTLNAIFNDVIKGPTQIIAYAWDSFGGEWVFFNGLVSTGWYATIQLLLLALDLMIIYPLTDSIARMLGGTIRLSLGGKLKMA